MRTILIVLFLLLFFIASIPILLIEWIIGKINKRAADISQLRIVQWGFRVVLFLSGTKVDVRGEENVPKDEAVLYVGNHRGFYDTVISYSRCPGLTGYISKNNVAKVPGLSHWMRRLYCLFIDRDDIKQGLKIILQAIEQVKSGISICIFPEGTRNKNENPAELLPFKEGSFKIAQKTNCKIIPMALVHTDDIFENQFPWIKRAHVVLEYGKPIIPSELAKEDQKHLGAYCQGVISSMLENIVSEENNKNS